MIYFIYPNVDIWEYMVEDIDDKDVVCRPLNPNCNKLQLVCRKLLNNQQLPSFMLFGSKMRKELRELGTGDTVLIPDYIDVCLFRTISSIVKPEVKKALWIWNPVKVHERERMHRVYDAIVNAGFEISTFDAGDAERYGQKLYSQFFRMRQDLSVVKEEWDFYFIGYEKSRRAKIAELREKLKGFRTYFKVVHKASESLTYSQNIENIKKAKCIIEIVQEGQKGMTLRPLEAMAFGKKLLSNNKSLKDSDFYNKNNIFIFGVDDISGIGDFMSSPYVPVDDEIMRKYDLNTWLNNYRNT